MLGERFLANETAGLGEAQKRAQAGGAPAPCISTFLGERKRGGERDFAKVEGEKTVLSLDRRVWESANLDLNCIDVSCQTIKSAERTYYTERERWTCLRIDRRRT